MAFILLFCEMMQSVLMNSFCIGVIYARVSRALVRSFSYFHFRRELVPSFLVRKLSFARSMESGILCFRFANAVNTS